MLSESAIDFPENSYGVVRRVCIFWKWIEDYRKQHGRGLLSILDYGCGIGNLVTAPLGQGGDRIHGVDLHEPSIDLARQRHSQLAAQRNRAPNVTFSTESTADLRARGASYDIVICSEVLEHLTDPGGCLRDLRDLLLPGGLLLVTVPNGYGSFENLHRLRRMIRRAGIERVLERRLLGRGLRGVLVRGTHAPRVPSGAPMGYLNTESQHLQFFRLGQIRRLFAAAGFAIEESRGKVVLCGPYADWWLHHLSLGGRTYRLNGALADRLPLTWAAGWMFRLRRAAF